MPSMPNNETQNILETSIPFNALGQRLDKTLAQLFPEYSRSRLSQWIEAGAVELNGVTVSGKQAKKAVSGGELLRITVQPLPEQSAFKAEHLDLDIIHEDEALLVIYKPAGLVVHPGHGNWEGTLLNGLLYYCPELKEVPRAGIVHRLDKDTSGLLVVAKTVTAQTELIRQLQARTVKREYQALVWGTPAPIGQERCIDNWMGRHPKQRTLMSIQPEGYGKRAITFYRVIRESAHFSWVHCKLATGRTHQIRVHLSHLGYPILGDTVYGRRHDDFHTQLGQHALHAFRLTLEHPVTRKTLSWKAPLPEQWELFTSNYEWSDNYTDPQDQFSWNFNEEGEEIYWDEDEDDEESN